MAVNDPDHNELQLMAELSHLIERLASALAIQGAPEGTAADELVDLAGGHREALAIALSYALRTADRDPGDVPDQVVRLLRLALSPRHWRHAPG